MGTGQLVVVGSGPAGAAAALEAARAGAQVTLIDENPVDFAMMGLDIPHYFGQRMMPSLRDNGLTLQRVVSSNVWGSFRDRENNRRPGKPVLGLADEDRSWSRGSLSALRPRGGVEDL